MLGDYSVMDIGFVKINIYLAVFIKFLLVKQQKTINAR